jgi:hypothetical protein
MAVGGGVYISCSPRFVARISKAEMENIQSHKNENSACRLQVSIQFVEEHKVNIILHMWNLK